MGKDFPEIDAKIEEWIRRQKMFFVATAPLSGDGLVNCSPKGMDCFRVLGPKTVGYLDLTGSGIETIAHVRENGRIVIMMCAFEGPPKIYRFYGKGEILELGTPEFDALLPKFEDHIGARSIIKVNVERIRDSCGFAVPRYEFLEDRDTLTQYCEKSGKEGLQEYRAKNNQKSLDGLAGLESLQ